MVTVGGFAKLPDFKKTKDKYMNKKMIKELLKAHCTIENGRWVFKPIDIDAATLELEQVLQQTPCTTKLICPKCENPYPHSHTDGSYSCEDCGYKWAN